MRNQPPLYIQNTRRHYREGDVVYVYSRGTQGSDMWYAKVRTIGQTYMTLHGLRRRFNLGDIRADGWITIKGSNTKPYLTVHPLLQYRHDDTRENREGFAATVARLRHNSMDDFEHHDDDRWAGLTDQQRKVKSRNVEILIDGMEARGERVVVTAGGDVLIFDKNKNDGSFRTWFEANDE